MNKLKTACWRAMPALLLLAITACNGAPKSFQTYQETIAQFQSATDKTSAATLEYIRSLNKFERDYEFRLLREDSNRPLDLPKILRGNFSPEAIQIRVQVFTVMHEYTDMLAGLAGSDAVERWEASTKRLKSNAEGLVGTLSDAGIKTRLGNLPISQITTPLESLANTIAKEIINKKRADALDAAIKKAAPTINSISQMLRRDVLTVVRQRDSVAILDLSKLGIAYTTAREAKKESERLRLLGEIRTALDAREAQQVELSSLSKAIDGFNAAHDALVAYARSDKGPGSLSDLVAAVAGYARVAKDLLDAVKVVSEGTG